MALVVQSPPLVAQPGGTAERQLSLPRVFTGVYVTNFEIGYFVECDLRGGGCLNWVQQELRWLDGSSPERDVALMGCIAKWNGSRDRWAIYAISFRGRETLDRRPKQFLNDTERRVLFDDLLALELIGTDDTEQWLLPRYRRLPTMTC
jgi:hypothetical protein